jgi:hypothetical protein
VTNEPNRLRTDASDFERQLLEAAGSEVPPPELVLGMRQALGFGSLSLPPAAAIGAKSSAVGWVSASVVVAVLGAGAALWQFSRAEPAPLSPRPALAAPTVEAPLAGAANPAAGEAAPASAAPANEGPGAAAAAAAEASPSAARAKAAVSSPSDAKRDLREEIELIDAARAAVARRAPDSALESLRRYFTNYPRGAFTPEAQVLRIEALEQSGRHAQALPLANAFLARHPDSPLAERVERSVGLARGL